MANLLNLDNSQLKKVDTLNAALSHEMMSPLKHVVRAVEGVMHIGFSTAAGGIRGALGGTVLGAGAGGTTAWFAWNHDPIITIEGICAGAAVGFVPGVWMGAKSGFVKSREEVRSGKIKVGLAEFMVFLGAYDSIANLAHKTMTALHILRDRRSAEPAESDTPQPEEPVEVNIGPK